MQELFGLPCPFCGGTRAFVYASSGDLGFLHYNGFWVITALATVLAGLLTVAARVDAGRIWTRMAVSPQYPLTVLVVGGWIWALLNRGTIVTG
ncbi:MAG: DUF2752 domain-containing protein, partial [Actinomycetota bacterium]|nr:DUF2752 domain-containing protein [Actinomycetota bacterium]